MNIALIILAGIIIILIVILIGLLLRKNENNSGQLNNQIIQQMQQFQSIIQQQLQDQRQTLSSTNQNIGTRLDQAARLFGSVQEKLTQLEEGSKRIFEVGKDLNSLQDILKTPKLRGSLGELFLGDMLGQILHKNQYQLQYQFKSGEKVDAVVKLSDGIMVPIDSKFPLENFRKSLNDSENIDGSKKQFKADVKKHIQDIADKYILPNEGTFDFALMYIPAENIYYEIILKDDSDGSLLAYAFAKRVIPVSPNTLYIYLQAILLGLKGMHVEEEAKNILKHLQSLSVDFDRFSKDYVVLGNHLQNAQTKYFETERRINKINTKLEGVTEHSEQLPEHNIINE